MIAKKDKEEIKKIRRKFFDDLRQTVEKTLVREMPWVKTVLEARGMTAEEVNDEILSIRCAFHASQVVRADRLLRKNLLLFSRADHLVRGQAGQKFSGIKLISGPRAF